MTQKSHDTSEERRALYAGSFNPFTIGHASIVERGLQMFDRVIIVVGVNVRKHPGDDPTERVKHIAELYADEPRVTVTAYDGLTAEAAREYGAHWLLRGIRNAADFEYERGMAEVNRRLTGVDTVMLPSLPELQAVSSSMVRELQSFGADVSGWLPQVKQ